jgi:hypothetical protein
MRFANEKNKSYNTNKLYDKFKDIITKYSPREVKLSGGQFTWSNNLD